ncbi:MAG: 23S rRNA (guanosine(2251)-2'-O)-methyltransferase RlmB [Pseudomonadales bacterium]|nr:23S rRNA (guanosine(2251)-2'-O)-methyltransferase RlmB [Pseudomonadales bacterium]
MGNQTSDLVFGIHSVESLLDEGRVRVEKILALETRNDVRIERILVRARELGVPVERVSRKRLNACVKSIKGAVHQGLIAETESVHLADEKELEFRWPSMGEAPLCLILDGVMDPRNLGACLRSAEAAGVDVVMLPKRRCAPLSAVARKTASGAAESLFLVSVVNLARRMRWLSEQGVQITGSSGETLNGQESGPWNEVDYSGSTAIVVGGEEGGMRALTHKHCDQVVMIPMLGAVESLNVSVATGIILYEAVRQRGQN